MRGREKGGVNPKPVGHSAARNWQTLATKTSEGSGPASMQALAKQVSISMSENVSEKDPKHPPGTWARERKVPNAVRVEDSGCNTSWRRGRLFNATLENIRNDRNRRERCEHPENPENPENPKNPIYTVPASIQRIQTEYEDSCDNFPGIILRKDQSGDQSWESTATQAADIKAILDNGGDQSSEDTEWSIFERMKWDSSSEDEVEVGAPRPVRNGHVVYFSCEDDDVIYFSREDDGDECMPWPVVHLDYRRLSEGRLFRIHKCWLAVRST